MFWPSFFTGVVCTMLLCIGAVVIGVACLVTAAICGFAWMKDDDIW